MQPVLELLNFRSKKNLRQIFQTEAAECGLACLAMITYYYGHKIDLNSLRRNYPVSMKGSSLNDIIDTASELKLSARAVRVELEDINKLELPCILHWDLNHYVVLKKVNSNSIVVLDPSMGERKFTNKEVDKHFTGVALELTPTGEFNAVDEEKKLRFSDLWTRITGLKRYFLQIFVLSILLQLFAIATPFYVQVVIDDVVLSANMDLLKVLALGFLLLALINVGTTALRSWVITILGAQLNVQIASNLFRQLVRLPLDWFEKRHIGDVVSRFGSLDEIKEILTTGVIEAIVDGIMIIGTLCMMYVYNPMLASIVLFAVALYGFFRFLLYKPLKQQNEENIIAMANEDTNFIETVRAVHTVKVFGKENQRQSVWQNLYTDAVNTDIRLNTLKISDSAANGLVFGAENVLVIFLAAQGVIAGTMSIGMVFAFLAYKLQFTDKATSLINKLVQFGMLDLHLNRISDIALNPQEENLESHLVQETLRGSFEVEDASFRFSPREPLLLDKTSFTIQPGQSLAITGLSGCGKTTLLKVMLGLLEPESGVIKADGIDIARMGYREFRKHIAAVMQDDQLFTGTIADNISFFETRPVQENVEKCAKMAAIHDDIMGFPMGYDTVVGDIGNTLSGGQKQRIFLARALYKKPKILFLDEATSQLDTHHESVVNDSIKHLRMTRIVIAHRPETIRSAERVMEMRGGKLYEVKAGESHLSIADRA